MVVIDGVNYLTVDEVCRLLDVKPATIYAYVSRGVLRSYKQGIKRQRLYREDEIERLLVIRPPTTDDRQTETQAPSQEMQAPQPAPDPQPVQHTPERLPDASSWIAER
jgi:excisionase family DNA binding protein